MMSEQEAYVMRDEPIKGEVVMSPASLKRLPPMFEEIVVQGRALREVLRASVVNLKLGTNMIQRARFLRKEAEKYCWGDPNDSKRG